MARHKILISACLVGEPVRYHGGDSRVDHCSCGSGTPRAGWSHSALKLQEGYRRLDPPLKSQRWRAAGGS